MFRAAPNSHPELSRAAIDGVRKWEFDATLLNCVQVSAHIGQPIVKGNHDNRSPAGISVARTRCPR